jgi:hypothetical protein
MTADETEAPKLLRQAREKFIRAVLDEFITLDIEASRAFLDAAKELDAAANLFGQHTATEAYWSMRDTPDPGGWPA